MELKEALFVAKECPKYRMPSLPLAARTLATEVERLHGVENRLSFLEGRHHVAPIAVAAGLEPDATLDELYEHLGKVRGSAERVAELEAIIVDLEGQISDLKGHARKFTPNDQLRYALSMSQKRATELENVIRRLHDQVDRTMGDTDLDDDPLVEAMGDAWNAISEQTGVGPAPDQGGEVVS